MLLYHATGVCPFSVGAFSIMVFGLVGWVFLTGFREPRYGWGYVGVCQ